MLTLDRTLEHLGHLYATVQAFIERDPCGVSFECDVQTREHVFRLRVFEQPPSRASILAAECIHGLRQSLDHIAYRLAVFVGGDPPPNEDMSSFPIFAKPRQGQTAVLDDDRLATKIGRPSAVPSDLRAILEDLQPYHGGDRERLLILDQLDNIAKHRFLPIGVTSAATPNFQIGELHVSSITGPRMGRLEHGTEVLRFRPLPDTNVNMGFEVAQDISFESDSPARGEIITKFVDETRKYILYSVIRPLESWLVT
jgi:hypothetical protein